jgi:hypothetical protein
MTDARSLADDAVHHLDRLAAAILDDVGDGPAPADFAAIAADVRAAVGNIGVSAFSELTGLIARIADSMVGGSTEWSPSLGGTLMSSVDDLRTLVVRAAQFSAEDGEHLHHRAAELAVYAGSAPRAVTPTQPPAEHSSERTASPAAVVDEPAPAPTPSPAPATGGPSTSPSIVPISELFYTEGPQVVSGGVPKSAAPRSDLLGAAVEALDKMSTEPLATPSSAGPMVIVPVETLIYRGRAALERAAAIREQLKSSGSSAPAAVLDEMYDLIGLALKD